MPYTIAHYFSLGLLIWLLLLAALIGQRLLSGRMGVAALFRTSRNGTAGIEPERLQLFVVFLAGVLFYAKDALAMLSQGPIEVLPEPPDGLIEVLVGSNTLYLAGKFGRTLPGR